MSLNRPVKIDNFIYPQAEDAGDHHVLQQIEEHGWSLIAIPGDPVEGPPFAFSIGFYLHTLEPEILIMGMDAKSSHYVIEKIHDYIQAGNTLKVDQPYADILDGGSLLFSPDRIQTLSGISRHSDMVLSQAAAGFPCFAMLLE